MVRCSKAFLWGEYNQRLNHSWMSAPQWPSRKPLNPHSFSKVNFGSIFNNFTEQEKALFACFHEPCCIVPFRSYIDQDQILHTAQENTAARGAFKSRKSEASYIDAMPSNNYLKTATFWS